MLKKITDKILAIKIDDGMYGYAIQKTDKGIVNLKVNYDNLHDYYVLLPKGDWVLVGYSHQLTDTQIYSLGLNSKEFGNLLEQNDVRYNYTSWEGKWLILYDKSEQVQKLNLNKTSSAMNTDRFYYNTK